MNESSAIQLCLVHHDPRGFEFLVDTYSRQAYLHAFGFLGNAIEAEDACQESFARAFTHITRLKSLPSFYPWFYQILKHGCLNRLRDRKPTDDIADVSVASPTDLPGELAQDREKQQVWRVLHAMKPEFREILIMKHLEELPYASISEILQIPRGTVMSRLHHARAEFRRRYYNLSSETAQTRKSP